ncbi:MAG: xanthine dehydrogenase family protein subunit M [SAR324 cluster bacterium]|nr:xanthine dehydrogenase family protein subunit M [SAR324 cluster bacterium]
MIPSAFEYYAPGSVAEAIALLKTHGDEAKILSGGHSLIPLMKLRFASPAVIIDINGIPGLDYVKEEGGFLKIGALAREASLESSPVVQQKFPLIADVVKVIADPQVRNRATVAGNLAHGDPANDHPAVMLALGAEVELTGPGGSRTLPVSEFFVDLLETALTPEEVLTEIRVPVPPAGSGGAYYKIERKVGDFATIAVGSQVTLDSGGRVTAAGIGLTNAATTPIKATDAEAYLVGKSLDDATLEEAGRLAMAMSDPSSDSRAPAAYKKAMVKELTIRTLKRAAERARGGQA